jgi:hypothetical protein
MDFRSCFGSVEQGEGGIIIDEQSARLIGAGVGDIVTHVAR